MKKVLFLVIMFSLTIITNCKNDENELEQVFISTDTTELNCQGECQEYLCNGSNNTMFIPFDVVRKWKISSTGILASSYLDIYVGTEVIDSQNYYRINKTINSEIIESTYYRINIDGEIFIRKSNDSNDYLFVSEIKNIGYEWEMPDTNTSYKIVSKDASIDTSICSYTELIKIEVYKSGNLNSTRYFKKGLGLVFESFESFESWNKYLKNIELQY